MSTPPRTLGCGRAGGRAEGCACVATWRSDSLGELFPRPFVMLGQASDDVKLGGCDRTGLDSTRLDLTWPSSTRDGGGDGGGHADGRPQPIVEQKAGRTERPNKENGIKHKKVASPNVAPHRLGPIPDIETANVAKRIPLPIPSGRIWPSPWQLFLVPPHTCRHLTPITRVCAHVRVHMLGTYMCCVPCRCRVRQGINR